MLHRLLYNLEKSYFDGLDKLLHNENYVKQLMGLPENELTEVVGYLSDTVNRLIRVNLSPRKCLHVLRKLSSTRRVLPSTYEISGTLTPLAGSPVFQGAFGDAQRGSLSTSQTIDVCIKTLRIYGNSDRGKIKELFCREAIVWKHLNHPNIVPFKGVTLEPLQLVSEWMPGGELRRYVRKNPDANLIRLLLGVAEGLAHLHSCGIIHGDLKGPNIVVDEFGNARIMDFGFSSVSRDPSSIPNASDDHGHTPRWTAPEILQPGGASAGTKSDVFSFAMVIYEVFSGKAPFHEVASPAVPATILSGRRPSRPTHSSLVDSLWNLAEKCWNGEADGRPEMDGVVEELKRMKWVPLPPTEEAPAKTEGPVVPYSVDPHQPRQTKPGTEAESERGPKSSKRGWEGREQDGKPPHKKSQKDLRHEKKRKEAEDTTMKEKGTPGERPSGTSESTTAVNIQADVIPISRPTTQEPPSHRDNYKNVLHGPSSGSRVSVNKLPHPPVTPPSKLKSRDSESTIQPRTRTRDDQSEDQTLRPPVPRPDQEQPINPTENQYFRNPGGSTPQRHGQMTINPALPSQLPAAPVPKPEPPPPKKGFLQTIFSCCC